MKKSLLIICLLGTSIGHVVGGEKPTVVVEKKIYDRLNAPVEIFVSFSSDTRDLYYVGAEKMGYFRQKHADNSPCFINCRYQSTDLRVDLPGLLNNVVGTSSLTDQEVLTQSLLFSDSVHLNRITEFFETLKHKTIIPFSYFLNDKGQFKNKGEVLFSFTEKIEEDDILFEIKLKEGLDCIKPEQIIGKFFSTPLWIREDEEALKGKNIIVSKHYSYGNGVMGHGEEYSYRAEIEKEARAKKQAEDNQERLKEREQVEQKDLFYARLKKLFCGGSITIIALYALYKKFYSAAH